mmetsp:Transcript_5988/g.5306  ORF Transcript_5988/g.5306 Transcript_5988/m.5306 type:complete len:97 (+) Transcript_5988:427-717(+)
MAEHEGSPVNVVLMDSDFVASGDEAGTVNIRKIFSDDKFHVKISQSGPVTGVLFSTDGASLFTSTTNHVVTEWSIESGDKLREFVGEEGSKITSMA